MIAPLGAPTFREGLRWAAETFHALGALLHEEGLATTVGDEGGYAPSLGSNEDAIAAVLDGHRARRLHARRADRHRARPGHDRAVRGRALHAGARGSHADRRRARSTSGPIGSSRYPIVSLEDGLAEDDWQGWTALTERHRGPRPAGRRRPARHEHAPPGAGDPRARREQHPRQAQPDRDADRDDRGGRDGAARGLDGGDQPPVGRDRGHDHRGPRGRPQHRPDQDRLDEPIRADREVQPAPADRGGARRRGRVRRSLAPSPRSVADAFDLADLVAAAGGRPPRLRRVLPRAGRHA